MKITKADSVPASPVQMDGARDVQIRQLIGEPDGAPNFHMRQFTVAPGGHTPRHTHAWEHECYILAGSGVVQSADGEKPVAAGDVVFVAPDDLHNFKNTGETDLRFLCMIPKPIAD